MITSAAVFIVHPVRCCCLINQDAEALRGQRGREVTPKGVCGGVGGVVLKAICQQGPAPCPQEYMNTLMCSRRQTRSISRGEMYVCAVE